MYRVMLIDDELPVRKLMLSSIDWASLDMEVVGEAASGIEAINPKLSKNYTRKSQIVP